VPLARFVRIYGDWGLALVLAVLFQIEVWTIDPSHPPGDVGTEVFSSTERAAAAAAGLVLALSLAWRRRAPLVVLGVAIATSVVANVVGVPAATWVYLSSLLTIALYFKFSRLWSVRNLDLFGLILLAPGLLLVAVGAGCVSFVPSRS